MTSNCIKNRSSYVDNSKTFESLNTQKRQFYDFTAENVFHFWSEKVVVIDPGHGGMDSGAVGVNGIYEKDVVLNIAKEVLNLNKSLFDNELDIYLTRYGDTLISLSDRSRLAKSLDTDVFVSLHCNSSPNNSRGVEVYVHHSRNKKSITLGVPILNESTQKLGFAKRGVKFADFQVLRETILYCPSVLVEMGFMTNTNDADYFLETKNIGAMGLALLNSVLKI